MHNCQDESLVNRWFPVAVSSDLPKRHVFHGQLLGEELAVWRCDDGAVNAWENRCPHRGVRLSIGMNLGRELKCQYHGMQFASESGQCTFMPAHRDMPPARALCVKTYPCREQDGLVWATLGGGAAFGPSPLEGQRITQLRSLPFNASALLVAEALTRYRFSPSAGDDLAEARVTPIDAFTLQATVEDRSVIFLLQPVDVDRAVLHGALTGPVASADHVKVLRHHNENLAALRRSIESAGARLLSAPPEGAGHSSAYRKLVDGRVRYGVAA